MKKLLLVGLILISSGAWAQGPHGNITIVSTGLKVDSAFMVSSHKRVLATGFAQGVKVYMDLVGIHGMSVRDGNSFPGCSMKVVDSKKNVVLSYEDLFSGDDYKDGVSYEKAKVIAVNLTVGSPMKEGEAYTWNVRVWDKIGGGELTASVPVSVVAGPNDASITKTFGGLTCESAYVISDGVIATGGVKDGQKLNLILAGMKGYKVSADKKVTIGAKVIVRNSAGKNIMEYADLFKGADVFDASKAGTITMYLTIGDPILSGQSYTWVVRLWDKANDKWIEAAVPLDVVE